MGPRPAPGGPGPPGGHWQGRLRLCPGRAAAPGGGARGGRLVTVSATSVLASFLKFARRVSQGGAFKLV